MLVGMRMSLTDESGRSLFFATSIVWSRSQGRQDQQEEQEGEEEQAEEGQSRSFTSDCTLVVSTVSAKLAFDDSRSQVRGTAKRKAGEPAKKK
jgi:hypothetical protein